MVFGITCLASFGQMSSTMIEQSVWSSVWMKTMLGLSGLLATGPQPVTKSRAARGARAHDRGRRQVQGTRR